MSSLLLGRREAFPQLARDEQLLLPRFTALKDNNNTGKYTVNSNIHHHDLIIQDVDLQQNQIFSKNLNKI